MYSNGTSPLHILSAGEAKDAARNVQQRCALSYEVIAFTDATKPAFCH